MGIIRGYRRARPAKTISRPTTPSRGSVKYVELFGTLSSLGAGLSKAIIDYTIPDGYGAELYAIGIQPDYDPATGTSNLLDTEIGYDNKLTGIKFLTNHVGKNFLPYGDRASKQPIRLLDYPMRVGNLTPKFNEGMRIQIVVTAGSSAVSNTVNARAKVLLYEDVDARAIYGVGIDRLATIPGGVEQSLRQELFADYVDGYTTAGKGAWEDAYTKSIKDFEQVRLTHIGVVPDAHSDELKIRDLRTKQEFPEYEPFYKVNEVYNALPFGDDDDYQPTQRLPSVIASHIFSNTTLEVKVKDDGNASTLSIQLLGTYRRVR